VDAGALALHAGIHWGPVLTDGALTVGDALALAAAIADSGARGEIRLSAAAYDDLASRLRVRCRVLPPLPLAAGGAPVELVSFEWRDSAPVPTQVRCRETGQTLVLPARPTFTIGRAAELDPPDVPISLPDRAALLRISRRHVEVRRESEGLFLYPLADNVQVDGQPVGRGQRARIEVGSFATLTSAMSLIFDGAASGDDAGLQTVAVVRSTSK
jgi:hypothetical protein